MEIQYQRNLKNSYMIVIEKNPVLNMDGQLAEKMLSGAGVDGLLKYVTMEHEGQMTFWYNITGYQNLKDIISLGGLDSGLIKSIFKSLMSVADRLINYYLREEHILLGMDQIYMDSAATKVWFTYAPMEENGLADSVFKLLEQMLPFINHDDKEAVKLGYGLYEACKGKNSDIWKAFEAMLSDSGGRSDAKSRELSRAKKLDMLEKPQIVAEEYNYAKDTSIIGKLKSFFTEDIFTKEKEINVEEIKEVEKEEAELEVENDNRWATENIGTDGAIAGCLKYEGNGRQEDMFVDKDVYLIGCHNPKANGNIKAASVSRNHARVTREGDKYYIEDLNSRNGTFLNGDLLTYRQRFLLSPGDSVRFAAETYRFY